ncbi:hypothetical protein PVW48_06980 [Dinoroseobacter sp. PD6]|uniref:hypothetical protein n=1 Tax=Dinoroseobacter sp. PD6 TaxID=3028384 RepID=UPI00237BF4E0|nr:hypothetical protein [Dinoroseobacter sp. PD6]MDD9716478.1 hypothetical protein [Dinoroseobacter sp. PD6]
MRLPFLSLIGLILLAGCSDLRFLDTAISEAALAAEAPELAPLSELPIAVSTGTADTDPTEALLARGAALRDRAGQNR